MVELSRGDFTFARNLSLGAIILIISEFGNINPSK
jgi:hypothetical protein